MLLHGLNSNSFSKGLLMLSVLSLTKCLRTTVMTSALLLSGLVLGCGGAGSGTTTPPPPTLAATATTLTASPTSGVAGTAVVLTATTTLSGGGAASGSVSFSDSGTSLGNETLNASGVGTLSVSTLAAGSHAITATFAATTTEAGSSSSAVTVTITAAPPTLTSTTATLGTATGAVIELGVPIELVSNVTASGGSAVPTGTVTFADGGKTLATAALDASGRAITTFGSLASGAHALTAAYSGDKNFASSMSTSFGLTIPAVAGATSYTNPLTLKTGTTTAISCADPATIKVQTGGSNTWYLYCTSDALYAGDPATHYINVFESKDLINFTYDGDAFTGLPSWAPNGQLWAPAIKFMNGQYMLYYTSPSTNIAPTNGAAIGVGVSSSPKGPFVDHGSPVVNPEATTDGCCGGGARSTIDPDVVTYSGQNYISFGSFSDGIFSRKLSADGFTSDASSEVRLAASNRYEGGAMWLHGGYYYLFTSSANCCNGPLTGYSVFVARALTPAGPFLDQNGVDMAAVNTGGNEVLSQNGNNWIGPGGNVLFTDEAGQDYMLYHAVSQEAPTYAGSTNYTARPALIDAVEWGASGWPTVRGGFGPSALAQPAPAAQPGATNAYKTQVQVNDAPAAAVASLSDEFNGSTLSSQWSTLHAAPAYTFSNGAINLPTVSLDSCCEMAQLPMLVESAPATDYMVETKLTMNLPVSGSGYDFTQGDLFIYGDDSDFVRLDLYSNFDTRQVEFVKQMTKETAYDAVNGASNLAGPTLANGVVSVYLRIVKRTIDDIATYTAYSSQDGTTWYRGATWQGTYMNEKIGIAGANTAGYVASYDYIHVSTLQ